MRGVSAFKKIPYRFTFFLTVTCDVLYSMDPLEFPPLWGGVPKRAFPEVSVMRQSMKIGFVLLLVIGVLGVLEPAWSQEVTAAIVGTVVDPSGAPIKDATVTATDTERGTVRTAQTNDAGAYNITRVPVGTY